MNENKNHLAEELVALAVTFLKFELDLYATVFRAMELLYTIIAGKTIFVACIFVAWRGGVLSIFLVSHTF